MKQNKTYLVSLFIMLSSLFITSCQTNVMFHDAVPPGVKIINDIPETFHGVYLCESDSSLIYVDRFLVYRESHNIFNTTIERVTESEHCSIKDQGIYFEDRQQCIPFEYISDDTIMAKLYEVDTLFNFRNSEAMKYYKGRLFMNYKNDHNEWTTFMISPLEDGALNWEFIRVPDKVEKVKAITHNYRTRITKKDKTIYVIKPTLVEFEHILEKDYTVHCDILNPVYLEY